MQSMKGQRVNVRQGSEKTTAAITLQLASVERYG